MARGYLSQIRDVPQGTATCEGFQFQLVMLKGDKVLYENTRMGNRLAECFNRIIQARGKNDGVFVSLWEMGTGRKHQWFHRLFAFGYRIWDRLATDTI